MIVLLCVVLFFSGASALIFESVWFHLAGLAFGNGVLASSLVLASFMAGLAVGNSAVARYGRHLTNPFRVYAALEVAIAVSGFGLVLLLPQLNELLAGAFGAVAEAPWATNALRGGLAFMLMVVPTAAMGATLPVLVKGLVTRVPSFGRALGLLYGVNTLGAVCGALVGEEILMSVLGARGSGAFAATADLAAAGLAIAIGSRLPRSNPEPVAPPIDQGALSTRAKRLLAAAFLAGCVLFALEVVWFRLLQLWNAGTTRMFAVMLAVVLSGVGLGGLAASWAIGRKPRPGWIAALALLAGTAVFTSYAWLTAPTIFVRNLWDLDALVARAVPLMFPVSFLSGFLFPTIGQALQKEIPSETRAAGLLTLANTVGAALGALLGGFVLLPMLGMERSVLLLGSVYALVAVLGLASTAAPRTAMIPAGLAAVAFAASAMTFPFGAMRDRLLPLVAAYYERGGTKLVAVREGLTETILFLQRDVYGVPLDYRLVTNGYSMSGSGLSGQRYMRLFVYLPLALRPDPSQALLVSFGVGNTAKALTEIPSLEHIDVVDISRDILDMNSIVFPDPAEQPLADPRVEVHIEDGRYFLQTTDRTYDLITGEPPPPKMAGVVNLYSKEYFEYMRERLAPGGLVSYWVPMHSISSEDFRAIVRAFAEVFEETSLWMGSGQDWILLGSREPHEVAPRERIERLWQDAKAGPWLRKLGFEHPEQLAALFLADGDTLRAFTRDTLPVEDNFPHRISRNPPADPEPYYYAMIEAGEARARFAMSPQMARLWPEEFREAAMPWFEWRRTTHDVLSERRAGQLAREFFVRFDRVLTETDLVQLPLWLLGSEQRVDDIVRAQPLGRDPDLHLLRGHGALARRSFAEAAEEYGRAAELGARGGVAEAHQAYSLCLAGDTDGALEVLGRARIPAEAAVSKLVSITRRRCSPDTTVRLAP